MGGQPTSAGPRALSDPLRPGSPVVSWLAARPHRIDVALASAAALVAFAFSYGPGAVRMSLTGALLVAVLAALAVGLAGRAPVPALVTVAALAVGLPILGSTFDAFDLVVVLVVARVIVSSTVSPWVVAAVSLAALTINEVWLRLAFDRGFGDAGVVHPLLVTGLVVGLALQGRRLARQHAELVRLRAAERRRAVLDERQRIARDLHDVAAHHLTALIVRNRLATRLGTPEALSKAAEFSADTASHALDGVREVVAVLGGDDEQPPQPSLTGLDDIVRRMRAAGLDVAASLPTDRPTGAGQVAPLTSRTSSPEVEVAAVRIVSEALANVLRHRGPGRAWVAVASVGTGLEVVIEDDGPSSWCPGATDPPPRRWAGHGLAGMSSRAQSLGGHVEIGPSPLGGWRVHALLPGKTE